MKNKKILFLAVAAVVGASATVAAISGSTEALAKVFAAGGVEYHHYAAIDPTLDKPGIREFYKACDGSAPVFEAPAGAQIVESVLTEEQKAAIIAEGGARVFITPAMDAVTALCEDKIRNVFCSAGHAND